MSYQTSFFHLLSKLLLSLILVFAFTTLLAEELSLAKVANSPTLEWGPCPAFLGKECQIAVLHGDPTKPNSDVFFKVPGDYKIVNHWHTSAERMVLVTGTMDVTYEDEKTQIMYPGTYAYGPAKKPHRAYCRKGETCVLFIAFEKPIDAFEIK